MRRNRVGSLKTVVHKKLAEILIRRSNDPRFQKVTITRVEMDSDSTLAQVYVSVFPSDQKDSVVEALNHAAGFLSSCLGKTLPTRHTPKLIFYYDSGFDYSLRIDELIHKHIPQENIADH